MEGARQTHPEAGDLYPEEGTLQFSLRDRHATPIPVTVRAISRNSQANSCPACCAGPLEEGNRPDAILVPQLAVSRNSKGEPMTMVVGANSTVECACSNIPRGSKQLVGHHGLKPGDQVSLTIFKRSGRGLRESHSRGSGSGGDHGICQPLISATEAIF